MFELIKIGIIIAAISALAYGAHKAWQGFKDDIGQPYAAAQRAIDQPVIDKANKAQAAAELERDNAQTDTKACVASAAKQSDGIREWQARATLAEKRARDAEKAGRATSDARALEVHRYQVAAGTQENRAQTCEEKLADLDKALRDEARARAKSKAVPK